MELTNDPKDSNSPKENNPPLVEGTNNATAKHDIDDMELDENQLDIISGGGELPTIIKGS